jgi:hypothetical protein
MAEKPEDEPNIADGFTPLQQMAIMMHESFTAFQSAGFSEDQSMQLIMGMAEMGYNSDEVDDND